MREQLGITTHFSTDAEIEHFLSEHTYFYKLKSYAKNYDKNTAGPDAGKYTDLDFSYLRELSTLDMYLRKIVLDMTIDIEHYLKVKFLRDLSENEKEDGYSIIEVFLTNNTHAKNQIDGKLSSSSCSDLIAHNSGRFSAWQIVEILSFGSFIDLYVYYYRCYPDKYALENSITPVRFLRNAAAHNNGLIRDLRSNSGDFKKNRQICAKVSNDLRKKGIKVSSKSFNNKMSNRMIHDFICMLYVFTHIVTSEPIREKSMNRLKNLFEERFLKHQDYFEYNAIICSSYEFVKKVIDIYI